MNNHYIITAGVSILLIILLFCIISLMMQKKRRIARLEIARYVRKIQDPGGDTYACEEFFKCLSIMKWYGILPSDFGFKNIIAFKKEATASLIRCIRRMENERPLALELAALYKPPVTDIKERYNESVSKLKSNIRLLLKAA